MIDRADSSGAKKDPTSGEVGLACFDEGMWHPPTPRPTLTVSQLLN